jgi:hypothetical protein
MDDARERYWTICSAQSFVKHSSTSDVGSSDRL